MQASFKNDLASGDILHIFGCFKNVYKNIIYCYTLLKAVLV